MKFERSIRINFKRMQADHAWNSRVSRYPHYARWPFPRSMFFHERVPRSLRFLRVRVSLTPRPATDTVRFLFSFIWTRVRFFRRDCLDRLDIQAVSTANKMRFFATEDV